MYGKTDYFVCHDPGDWFNEQAYISDKIASSLVMLRRLSLQSASPPLSQLSNHTIDLHLCRTRSFRPQLLEGIAVLCFQSLFARFTDHAAFEPHLDALGRSQSRALGDEQRSHSSISGAEDFVEIGLSHV